MKDLFREVSPGSKMDSKTFIIVMSRRAPSAKLEVSIFRHFAPTRAKFLGCAIGSPGCFKRAHDPHDVLPDVRRNRMGASAVWRVAGMKNWFTGCDVPKQQRQVLATLLVK